MRHGQPKNIRPAFCGQPPARHRAARGWVVAYAVGSVLAMVASIPAVLRAQGTLALTCAASGCVFLLLAGLLAITLGQSRRPLAPPIRRRRLERLGYLAAAVVSLSALPLLWTALLLHPAIPTPASLFPIATQCAEGSLSSASPLVSIQDTDIVSSVCHSLSTATARVSQAMQRDLARHRLAATIRAQVSPSLSLNAETTQIPGQHGFWINVDSATVHLLSRQELAAVVGHELGHVANHASATANQRTAWTLLCVLAWGGWLALLVAFVKGIHRRAFRAVCAPLGVCLVMAMMLSVACTGIASVQRQGEYTADAWGAGVTSPRLMALALARMLPDCSHADARTSPFSDHPSFAARANALGVDPATICRQAAHENARHRALRQVPP